MLAKIEKIDNLNWDEPIPTWDWREKAPVIDVADVLATLNNEERHRRMWTEAHGGNTLFERLYGAPKDPLEVYPQLKIECVDLNASSDEHVIRLRYYVDLWIKTGVVQGDVEVPSERKPTWRINRVVEDYFLTHRFRPLPLTRGYSVSFSPPVTLADLVDEKTVEMIGSPLGLTTKALGRFARGRQRTGFSIAEDAAQRMFVGMLLSDWRYAIAKCRTAGCGRYFVLKRMRIYMNGTFCSQCVRERSLSSAGRRVQVVRREAEQELYRLVAKKFDRAIRSDGCWFRDPQLKSSIVAFLTKTVSRDAKLSRVYPSGVSTKWLGWSKNRQSIELLLR